MHNTEPDERVDPGNECPGARVLVREHKRRVMGAWEGPTDEVQKQQMMEVFAF